MNVWSMNIVLKRMLLGNQYLVNLKISYSSSNVVYKQGIRRLAGEIESRFPTNCLYIRCQFWFVFSKSKMFPSVIFICIYLSLMIYKTLFHKDFRLSCANILVHCVTSKCCLPNAIMLSRKVEKIFKVIIYSLIIIKMQHHSSTEI